MEFNPEVFAQVTMLYVTMDVGTSRLTAMQYLTSLWCPSAQIVFLWLQYASPTYPMCRDVAVYTYLSCV